MFNQINIRHDDEPPSVNEEEAVRCYRFDEFRRLGFDTDAAFVLVQAEADLALARRIVRQGCPLATALAILH